MPISAPRAISYIRYIHFMWAKEGSMRRSLQLIALAGIGFLFASPLSAQPLVPGTGVRVTNVGDDFEDEAWEYYFNLPKSSHEQDDHVRTPGGRAKNNSLFESAKRGQPDIIRRVPTPDDGLPGSTGCLFLASRHTGIPGRPSGEMQQDDLIINVKQRVGGYISVSREPSCVVRLYIPPFEKWENRTGTSFGLRAEVVGSKGWARKTEQYWPGFFIWFRSETDRRHNEDGAHFVLRAGPRGHDFKGPEIQTTGWWTLGMSFTSDGKVHYYASPGVDDLTQEDYIASQYPYGFRCQQFHTFFFNVANRDDGRTWSTGWVIDDPALYLVRPPHRLTQKQTSRR